MYCSQGNGTHGHVCETLSGLVRLDLLIIIIKIALKGAFWDFLQSPCCAVYCLQHLCSSGQGAIMCKSRATHQALITCSVSFATWYEGTAQLVSLIELKSHLCYFIGTINRWRRGGNWRKPLTTSFRTCHALKPENSSPNRDLNPHFSIGDRLGKQTC